MKLNRLCCCSCSCTCDGSMGIDDFSPIADVIAEDGEGCLSLSDGNEEERLSSTGDGCMLIRRPSSSRHVPITLSPNTD